MEYNLICNQLKKKNKRLHNIVEAQKQKQSSEIVIIQSKDRYDIEINE